MQFNLVVSTAQQGSDFQVWKRSVFDVIGAVPEVFYDMDKDYVDACIFYKSIIK
jgi:hypothetical protein